MDMVGRAVPLNIFRLPSDEQISSLGRSHKKTIAFGAEMVAVILAIRLWMERVRNAMVICFIDNNLARDIAISASGRSSLSMALIASPLQSKHRGAFFPWYARVPSPSNPADRPSKGDPGWLDELVVDCADTSTLTTKVTLEVLKSKEIKFWLIKWGGSNAFLRLSLMESCAFLG